MNCGKVTSYLTIFVLPLVMTQAALAYDSQVELIGFVDTALVAQETGGDLSVMVARHGSGEGAASVDYIVGGYQDTASAGLDFADITGTLVWADGEIGVKHLYVEIYDDSEQESDETISVTLFNASPNVFIDDNAHHLKVTIKDDESALQNLAQEGCFIATAAYGSDMVDDVMALRTFRDEYLLNSTIGKQFVTAYYRFSPPIAKVISTNSSLRRLTRISLTPLVWLSRGLTYTENHKQEHAKQQ